MSDDNVRKMCTFKPDLSCTRNDCGASYCWREHTSMILSSTQPGRFGSMRSAPDEPDDAA